jgi:hypothetical protein
MEQAGEFIKNYGEPHLAALAHNFVAGLWLYFIGVHVLIIASGAWLGNALFNSLINMGLPNRGFFDEHSINRWALIIRRRTIKFFRTTRLPKKWSYALSVTSLIVSLLLLG